MSRSLLHIIQGRQLNGGCRGCAEQDCTAIGLWAEEDTLANCQAAYIKLPSHPRSTIATAFSPNGRWLAATHGDHTVKVFDCNTGECVRAFTGHTRTPWVVRWHPTDNETLASGSLDCQVRVWNMSTGECSQSRLFGRAIASVAFVPASPSVLAIASGHKVYMWDYTKAGQKEAVAVLKTRRSLRAIHFPMGGEAIMLTAELVDPQPTALLPHAMSQEDSSIGLPSQPLPAHLATPSLSAAAGPPHVVTSLAAQHAQSQNPWTVPNMPRTASAAEVSSATPLWEVRPLHLPRSISAHGTLGLHAPSSLVGPHGTSFAPVNQSWTPRLAVSYAAQPVHMPRPSSMGSLTQQLPRVPSTHGFALPSSLDDGRADSLATSHTLSYTPSFPRVGSTGSALLTLHEEEQSSEAPSTGDSTRNSSMPEPVSPAQLPRVNSVSRSLLSRGMFRRPSAFASAAAQGGAQGTASSRGALASLGVPAVPGARSAAASDAGACTASTLPSLDATESAATQTSIISAAASSHSSRVVSEDGAQLLASGSQDPVHTPLASTLSLEEDVFGEAVEESPSIAQPPLRQSSLGAAALVQPTSSSGSSQRLLAASALGTDEPRRVMANSALSSGSNATPGTANASLVRSAPLPIQGSLPGARRAGSGPAHRWPMFQAQYTMQQDSSSTVGLAAAQASSPAPLLQAVDRVSVGSGVNSSVSVLSQQLAQTSLRPVFGTSASQARGHAEAAAMPHLGSREYFSREVNMPRAVSAVALGQGSTAQAATAWLPRAASTAADVIQPAHSAAATSLPTSMVSLGPELPASMLPHIAAAAGLPQLHTLSALEDGGTVQSELTLQERSCRVCLRLWRFDSAQPYKPISEVLMSVNDAMLCSEMGVHFSPDSTALVVCVACSAPVETTVSTAMPEAIPIPGSSMPCAAASPTQHPAQGAPCVTEGCSSAVTKHVDGLPARQLVYELRVLSLAPRRLGEVLCARRVKAAHCLTSLQVSPTSQHVLLAYGRRHLSLLRSLMADGSSITPVHTVLEVYRMSDLSLRCVLPSAEDEVNAACFHPQPGGGLVYGTKEGRIRLIRRDRGKPRAECAIAASPGSSLAGLAGTTPMFASSEDDSPTTATRVLQSVAARRRL